MNPITKTLTFGLLTLGAFATASGASSASETLADIEKTLGFTPQYLSDLPEVLPGAWEKIKTLELNPATALTGKEKELIGLAVAAQVPCGYCVEAHTDFAKLNGATKAEIGQAVAMAAITRHWSTWLNGIQTDEAKFRGEIAKLVDGAKRAATAEASAAKNGKAPGSKPASLGDGAPSDGAGALKDIAQTMGFVPDFLRRFPDAARAGAWRTMKEVQLNPATELSGKDKELVGLAVASQVPCNFCIIAHTEFAKLNGASEAEINEAIGMAALTREMSTYLNGMQVDKVRFSADLARLVKGAQSAAAKGKKSSGVTSR